MCSILAFTILRIVSIQRLDNMDLAYSFEDVAYWSVLEPLLGIVNACSPIIRPAIQKVFDFEFPEWSRFGQSTKKAKTYGSNTSASYSTAPNDGNFHRLHSQGYQLGDIDVEGIVTLPENSYSRDPAARTLTTSPPLNAIKVTRGWHVDSVSAA